MDSEATVSDQEEIIDAEHHSESEGEVVYIDDQGNQVEPEAGAVYIDEFGNMVVGKSQNDSKSSVDATNGISENTSKLNTLKQLVQQSPKRT